MKIINFFLVFTALLAYAHLQTAYAEEATGCCNVLQSGNSGYYVTATPDQCQELNLQFKPPLDQVFTPNKEAGPGGYSGCVEKRSQVNPPKKTSLPVLTPPTLKVSIPGLDPFQKINCTEESCQVPWLAQYIAGLQRYAIAIVAILAVIVFMIAGIMWLTAGGDQHHIKQAQEWMRGSIFGMVIAFSAYIILYTINPNLTAFKSLTIRYIEKIDLTKIVLVGHSPQFDLANGKPIEDTTFDNTFKSFAGCINVDWRILKGIAFKESHLDANVVNSSGFIGLFQTKQMYCEDSIRQLGLPASFCSATVYDPAVNTAVATGMMKTNMGIMNKKCSSASDGAKLMMIYYAHSNGCGALTSAMANHGCNPDSWPENIFKGSTKNYAKEVVGTILAQGVTSIGNTSGNGTCPK